MKYDDASWHYGGDFPEDLPDEAGATHTGMFVAWALLSGLAGELHTAEAPEALQALQRREITPGAFFLEFCDGKFTDEDLNDLGNAFARDYFDLQSGQYIGDYSDILSAGTLPTLYHVPDSWETYEAIKPALDARFTAWRTSHEG
jgi:hypothetical protein